MTTVASLRREIDRLDIRHFKLAAAARVNPSSLSFWLNERRAAPPGMLDKLMAAAKKLKR